ncbi:MAG: YqhA family protein, partial [Methanoregulaceae archaeon]|nr:YqhA family protein [Methanoregulaceae archaeon]
MAIDSDTCEPDQGGGSMIKAIVSSSKWLFTLAVIGTALISVFLFAMGFIVVIYAIVNTVVNPDFSVHFLKDLLATFIEIIDVFLVATVFYI